MSGRSSSHGQPGYKKTEVSLVGSPVAEYLTVIAANGQGGVHLKTTTSGLRARGRVCLFRPCVSRQNLAHDRYEHPRNCRHRALA
jgi:hypothetical protein